MPDPLYTAANCHPAYQLNWSLSVFWKAPAPPDAHWLDQLQLATDKDGVRILEHRSKASQVTQFLISTKPDLAPPQIVRSVKGRLQYLVRDAFPRAFRRNFSIHSIGSASRQRIDEYVRDQLTHHRMADGRVQAGLSQYQIHHPDVDLSPPQRASHGEYRYNLHVVLVNDGRWHEVREEMLKSIKVMIVNAARSKEHRLARAAILTDHVHLLVGCNLTESPQSVALGYLNNLAYAQGMQAIYRFGYYVGTVGEYDLGAVRRNL